MKGRRKLEIKVGGGAFKRWDHRRAESVTVSGTGCRDQGHPDSCCTGEGGFERALRKHRPRDERPGRCERNEDLGLRNADLEAKGGTGQIQTEERFPV